MLECFSMCLTVFVVFQNPPSSRVSPVPSPPLPSSPSLQQQMINTDLHTTNLNQQLQRLHLQQTQYTTTPPPTSFAMLSQKRNSPPNIVPYLTHSKSGELVSPSFHFRQNFPQTHSRSSSPPGPGQNLQMIKEDSLDTPTEHSDKEKAPPSMSSPTHSPVEKRPTPQISITDTCGHVTPMPASEEEDMETEGSHDDQGEGPDSSSTECQNSSHTRTMNNWNTYPFSLQYAGLDLSTIPDEQPNVHPPIEGPSYSFPLYRASPVINFNNPHSFQTYQSQPLRDTFASTNALIKSEHFKSDLSESREKQMERSSSLDDVDKKNFRNGLSNSFSSLDYTSKRTMSDLLEEIKRALDRRSAELVYERLENRFRLQSQMVQMEMEIYPGISERGLKIRKIDGDAFQYRRLCSELIKCIDL